MQKKIALILAMLVLGAAAVFAQEVKVETFTENSLVWVEKEIIVDNSKNPNEAFVLLRLIKRPKEDVGFEVYDKNQNLIQYYKPTYWDKDANLQVTRYTIPANTKTTIKIKILDENNSVTLDGYYYSWMSAGGNGYSPFRIDVITFDKSGKGTAK